MNKKILLMLSLTVIFLVGCTNIKENKELKENIEALIIDKMDGRYTGTTGNELAAEFIYSKFEDIDLVPFLADNYAIGYPHQFYNPEKAKYQLIIHSENGELIELERGIDYLERTGFTHYDENFHFTFDLDDKDLSNSFIILENQQNLQAVYGQAKGYFIVEDNFSNTILVDTMEKPIIQISKELFNTFKKVGKGTITLNMTQESQIIEVSNIVGKIPGKKSENAVVISAHFDHVGSIGSTIYRGAIDNASGVAMLLDIAAKVKKSDVSFSKDIIFAAFNGEESGMQGSRAFIEQLQGMYENVYNINLDSFYDGPLLIVSEESELTGNLLTHLTDTFTLHQLDYLVDLTGGLTSDHTNFLRQHYNAITISSQNVTAIIHKETDSIELINFSFLNDVSDTIVKFIHEYDHEYYAHIHESVNEIEHQDESINSKFIEQDKIHSQEFGKLSYGEYKWVELDKEGNEHMLIVRDSYTFEDLKDFNHYYPTIEYNSTIEDYQLKKITVLNTHNDKIFNKEYEVNKVYKSDILLRDLEYLRLSYYQLENKLLDISVMKGKHEIYDGLFVEEKMVQNTPVLLVYDSEKRELLIDAIFFVEMNGQTYTIKLSRGEEVVEEFQGSKIIGIIPDLTIADIEDLIENIGIKNIAEHLIKTL